MAKKKSKSTSKKPETQATATENSKPLVSATVLLKLCRLCEAIDGPFFNIFDGDQLLARKINTLLPFEIIESDELPHKICFRCSAKVEELYEFVEKCSRTQKNLQIMLGKKGLPSYRKNWDEELSQKKITHDDACNELILNAMKGMGIEIDPELLKVADKPKDPPAKSQRSFIEESATEKLANKEPEMKKLESKYPSVKKPEIEKPDINNDEQGLLTPIKEIKVVIDRYQEKEDIQKAVSTRSTRSKPIEPPKLDLESSPKTKKKDDKTKKEFNETPSNSLATRNDKGNLEIPKDVMVNIPKSSKNRKKTQFGQSLPQKEDSITLDDDNDDCEILSEKAFDIMDYVSSIKVTGVGLLFQCKLCNRNFLKNEVLLSHGCAKRGKPDVIAKPEPKQPDKPPKKVPVIQVEHLDNTNVTQESHSRERVRPRPGPASKTKLFEVPIVPPTTVTPSQPQMSVDVPPDFPGAKGRYKLVPGPNNTFTLVEENTAITNPSMEPAHAAPLPKEKHNIQSKHAKKHKNSKKKEEIINLDDDEPVPPEPQVPSFVQAGPNSQPYPVGLFQTVSRAQIAPPTQVPFATPAMKKQSYTVVQTGNPSKLVISTKSKPDIEQAAPVAKPRKKSKKSKVTAAPVPPPLPETSKQQYQVPVQQTSTSKDNGFFTFINVDPLSQPSYVLPITEHNHIQEAQISTSTPNKAAAEKAKDVHKCGICNMEFTREKKMLAHIQQHYNQQEEEEPVKRKRGRYS